MTDFIWYFMIYSFLGFLLEISYARAVHTQKKDRKCFFLLPLCPVYGVGAVSILLLPGPVKSSPLLLLTLGALTATAAEFFVGLLYEKAVRVKFWDYSDLPGNLGGKVCLLFSALWGVLALVLVYAVQPFVSAVAAKIPNVLILPTLLLLVLDGSFTVWLLRRKVDTEALRWYQNLGLKLRRHELLKHP
ncbi:MAG: hypothetical protein EOM14_15815 [Clostridia bacterium]|nr:hypothetical protein [Clostridia bacterium]